MQVKNIDIVKSYIDYGGHGFSISSLTSSRHLAISDMAIGSVQPKAGASSCCKMAK